MKITLLPRAALPLIALIVSCGLNTKAQLPFKPIADAPANAEEQQQLDSLFAQARAASANVAPGTNAGYQRRQLSIELNGELESFVATHTNSAWTPGVRLWLARDAHLNCAYSAALNHFTEAWIAARGAGSIAARQISGEAMGGLAMSLALAGRLSELDALEREASAGSHLLGTEWQRAFGISAWARKHPTLAYKCGLYCLDQLGRLTQPGQFESEAITSIESSTNGFTAADLVQIASGVGLRVHAALLNSPTNLPVPSIVHLTSEHFILLQELRGNFYGVYDRAALGPRWLTAQEIAREASGGVIVSDAVPPVGGQQLTPLSAGAAAAYRGRVFDNGPGDHDDSPDDCGGSGGDGDGDGLWAGGSQLPDADGVWAGGSQPPSGCNCNGAPRYFVSEPWLNLWLLDSPLHYISAYGPDVSLRLAYNHRHRPSVVSGKYWQGALFGNYDGSYGLWASSWMSFAELKNDEITVDLLLPQGGWATFTFAAGSSVSDMNYRHNAWLEKVGASGNFTSLILHHPNGSGATYGLRNDYYDPSYRVYYRTEAFDAAGNKTRFIYDTSFTSYFGLTNVTAADGTSFTLQLDNQYYPNLPATVTNITSSYGASVSFRYTVPNYSDIGLNLTNITDAAGISSTIGYESGLGASRQPIGDAVRHDRFQRRGRHRAV